MKRISFNLRGDRSRDISLPPQPSSQFVPQWYRDGERFINKDTGGLEGLEDVTKRSGGLKSCVPFLDALIAGYMQPLSASIQITKNNGVDPLEWKYVEKNIDGTYSDLPDLQLINERHGAIGQTMPRPVGFSNNHMAWSPVWGWTVPKGWSVLVTHPLNRHDLPFFTSQAFMDSDRFHAPGNIPFFIKKDFIGIIEKGTPMYQLIPIKREKWLGYVKLKLQSKIGTAIANAAREVPYGFYRDKLWVKKHYDMEK